MSISKDENQLLANLYANFQGKKRKIDDWVTIAENCQKLMDVYKSKSQTEIAGMLGISREILRSTLKINELPSEIKKLIKERKINQDVAWRINSIKGKDKQIKVANAIVGLSSHDAREVVFRYRNNPELKIDDYIRQLKDSKDRIEKMSVLIVPLKLEVYSKLKSLSKTRNESVERMVSDILGNWVTKRGQK
jgi:DNA-binding protein Fis